MFKIENGKQLLILINGKIGICAYKSKITVVKQWAVSLKAVWRVAHKLKPISPLSCCHCK